MSDSIFALAKNPFSSAVNSHSEGWQYGQGIAVLLLILSLPPLAIGAENDELQGGEPYAHASESIGTVREVYDGRLMPDVQINTFRNIQRLFPTRVVERGDEITPFVRAEQSLADFRFSLNDISYDLFDVLALNRVAAIMIVKDDEVLFERYFMGNNAATRWMSMSVVKTVSVMLIGAAIEDGFIDSIEDPITDYLPQFVGTAYDGVTVEQIVTMTSGVDWNETYTDPDSDRRRMLDAQIGQQPGAILRLMAALPRHSAPGTRWNYSTGETQIAAALVRAATGKWAADYLSEKLWIPLGMESDATWWLESAGGLEVGGSGLAATLRDYTRIGLFLLNEGVIDGEQIVPAGFVSRAGSRTLVGGTSVDYGYGLWPLHDRSYAAIGIFGQYVFVDPAQELVVTILSAQPKPVGRDAVDEYAFLAVLSQYFSDR
ncbi:MAG: serine hydrolase domain-containing protein [Pseudohongiellaceae bacterium]